MGDNQATTLNDPAASAPDAAALEKGKGKAVDQPDVSMDEDEEASSEEEEEEEDEEFAEEEEDDDKGNLEPISTTNIIDTGRRTRGKRIDFAEAVEQAKAQGDDPMDDEDEDDEDFHAGEDNNDDHMQE